MSTNHFNAISPDHSKPIKRRVLFVLGVLWGTNGITSHLIALSKMLLNEGWEVAFASNLVTGVEGANDEALAAVEAFKEIGVKYYFVPFPNFRITFSNLINAIESISRLNTITRQFKPDIIHVHSLSITPYIKLLKLFYRFPFVTTCHMAPKSSQLDVKLGTLINRLHSGFLGDRMIAVSTCLRDSFTNLLRISVDRINVIFHGVDSRYFRPPSLDERILARHHFHISPHTHVVCLIGRLAPEKGRALFIQALAILKSQGITPIALFAGKGYGDDEQIIRSYALENGVLEQVYLLGMTDSRQVLWASDLLCFPSQVGSEAFGLVIPEAMLCGVVPIRTPAAGAFDQIEDGRTGFIVPFDDPVCLAERIKLLLERKDLRKQLSLNSIEYARNRFTLDKMFLDTVNLYDSLICEWQAK